MESQPNPESPVERASIFRSMPGGLAPAAPRENPAIDLDLSGWQARLIAAGITPSRVASPDLLGQLEQARMIKIDTVICSVLDTDPSVSLNASIAEAYTAELAAGIAVLSKLTGAGRTWITADPDKPSGWFNTVRSTAASPGLRLVPLRGDYPQTDPALMLFTLLQRRLIPGKLPTCRGVLLVDAATAVAVGKCAISDGPVTHTPLAVRDHFQRQTHLLNAPMGTRLGEVCEFLEINNADAAFRDAVFRAGDFLRDLWVERDTPLGNGELVIHSTARHLDANPDPCIHCGWCLEACPTRISPAGLLDAAQRQDVPAALRAGLDACIECGICSYVCPTRLPLLTAIRGLKGLNAGTGAATTALDPQSRQVPAV